MDMTALAVPRLIGLLVALAIPLAAGAQETIRADRTPLTYRDSGLYCNLQFWHCHKPEDDGVTNMLTPERAASAQSPWSFYITQGSGPATLLRQMAAGGKKVIVRASLGGHTGTAPSVDEMEQRLAEMMAAVDPDWLYAITLDEERVFWNGWAGALAELYQRCKKRWPGLPVYQWWTPMEVPDVRATSGWVALPADGWVIDLYGRGRQEFEKKLVRTLETGKPVIHIVWSSPDWPEYCGAKSWDEGGHRVFEDQLEICRSYNVPVAHFCTQQAVRQDARTVEEIRWGWHAVNPVVRQWYRQIEVLAEENRRLPDTALGFRTLDGKLFDWAHRGDGPQGHALRLDDRGRRRLSVPVDLGTVPVAPGEHPVPLGEAARYFALTCVLDGSAADLRPGLGVAGSAGRTVGASILFRIEPLVPVASLSATAHAFANSPDLGGAASVASSADGKEWSEPVRSDPASRDHTLVARRPGSDWVAESRFSTDPLWVRVQVSANAGVETNTAASLGGLTLSAAVSPPLN